MAENRKLLDPYGWFSTYLKNRENYVVFLCFPLFSFVFQISII
ncbi:hypothetical protein XBI1_340008 [Xenorhabdus bovienii str. Intermedium]|uniref:Uncharacterized protein n=1 Tax=Xenorhabdus bovienii str. Intermedium TaxID=1379677 RepID=A0A077QPX5_XENBV|nr:hypothetical protein XBI1_340008 [Xenorhabdus bovienii str. Intermedium]